MAEKGANGRYGEAAIAGWRDEYVTGEETLLQLAQRVGVRYKTLERHASNRRGNGGKTWGEMRSEFLDEVSRETQERSATSVSKKLAVVKEKSANVAALALAQLETRVSSGTMEDKDLIQAAKLATTIKIELGGDPNGVPVDIRNSLDELTVDELRKLAGGT